MAEVAHYTSTSPLSTYTDNSTSYVHGSLLQLSNEYYAVMHTDDSGVITLRTYYVSTDGAVITAIDSWLIDNGPVEGVSMFKVDGNVYAALFLYSTSFTAVRTFSISTTGVITKSYLASAIDLDAGGCTGPEVVRVPNTDIFLMSYHAKTSHKYKLRTYRIASTGKTVRSLSSYDAGANTYGDQNAVMHVRGDLFCAAYHSSISSNQIKLHTFRVDETDGTISSLLSTVASDVSGFISTQQLALEKAYSDGSIIVVSWVNDTGSPETRLMTLSINQNGVATPITQKTIAHTSSVYGTGYLARIADGYIVASGSDTYNGNAVFFSHSYHIDTAGAISLVDNGIVADTYMIEGKARTVQVGSLQSNVWLVVRSDNSNHLRLTTHGVGTDLTTAVRTTGMWCAVNTVPVLTSGRNLSGYTAGRDPIYVLDNDPDTYWQPSAFTDLALYIDLRESASVGGVGLWLHNYNEHYGNNKGVIVSYSDDDTTYYQIQTFSFLQRRTSRVPVVVLPFDNARTARYWKVDFINFDASPQTIKPEVSAVWLVSDHSLPYKAQRPSTDSYAWVDVASETRSGHVYTAKTSLGRHHAARRQFTLTNEDDWDRLLVVFEHARGSCRPVLIQSDLDGSLYYAVNIEGAVNQNQTDSEIWSPTLQLVDLGFLRVPYTNRTLTLLDQTVGLWQFRENVNDDSGRGNNFTLNTSVTRYLEGQTEHGKSVIDLGRNDTTFGAPWLSIAAGSASADFDMGTGSFTLEAWVRGVVNMHICGKAGSGETYGLTTAGFNFAVTGNVTRCWIRDSTTQATVVGATTVSDSSVDGANAKWHYLVITVDRSATNLMKAYVDGVYDAQVSLASVTGSISRTDRPFTVNAANTIAQVLIDSLCVTKRVLSATEIANRYAGRSNNGSWGM